MSCREGHNSVITSLAWFLTRDPESKRADEALVKKAFHDLRRQYAQEIAAAAGVTYPEDAATPMSRFASLAENGATPPPAEPAEVEEFLRDCESVVRHDSRIKDRLRPQWQNKLNAAIVDVRAGRVPDQATFEAWRHLEAEVRRRKEVAAARHVTDAIASADTQQVLQQTQEAWEGLRTAVATHGWGSLTDPDASPAVRDAVQQLHRVDEIAHGCDCAPTLNDRLAQTRSTMLEAREQVRNDPGDTEARTRLRQANARFAETLAVHPGSQDVRDALPHASQSAHVWAALQGDTHATRDEKMSTLEFLAGAQDRHLVQIGALSDTRLGPRAQRRKGFREAAHQYPR